MVTTVMDPSEVESSEARLLAERLNLPFYERKNYTISFLLKKNGAHYALVYKKDELKVVKDGQSFSFHPNMAKLRLDNIAKGAGDRLVELIGLSSGDCILDCTLGMGSDAIVFSHICGNDGRVTGVEKSSVLSEVTGIGLMNFDPRIEVVNNDCYNYLKQQGSNSFDFVYFDPMFDSTRVKSRGIEIVRFFGEYTPIDGRVVEEAIRVASRAVVFKDEASASILKRLNIPIVSKGRKTCYGIISI